MRNPTPVYKRESAEIYFCMEELRKFFAVFKIPSLITGISKLLQQNSEEMMTQHLRLYNNSVPEDRISGRGITQN